MDMMTVVGRRVSQPWLPAPASKTRDGRLRTDTESLPVHTWPVCWDLLSDGDTDCGGCDEADDPDEEHEDDPFLREAA